MFQTQLMVYTRIILGSNKGPFHFLSVTPVWKIILVKKNSMDLPMEGVGVEEKIHGNTLWMISLLKNKAGIPGSSKI